MMMTYGECEGLAKLVINSLLLERTSQQQQQQQQQQQTNNSSPKLENVHAKG